VLGELAVSGYQFEPTWMAMLTLAEGESGSTAHPETVTWPAPPVTASIAVTSTVGGGTVTLAQVI
jgi:hypothetical protein